MEHSLRVVVADSSVEFLDRVHSSLWDAGHEAEVCSDAFECVAVLEHFAPDVIVLDNELLWGGSAGVMARLAGSPHLKEVPVVLMSSENWTCDPFVAESWRVKTRLYKPVQLEELLRVVEVYGKERAPRQLSESCV